MKIFQSGINTLHIADSRLREHTNLKSFRDIPLDRIIPYLVDSAYRRLGIKSEDISKFLDFCKETSKKNGGFKVGILEAHGKYFFGKWCYQDGFVPKSVQKWIDEYDEVYDLLLLQVCNPKYAKPVIRKPIAVVPTNNVGHLLNSDIGIEHLVVIPNKGALHFNSDMINRLPQYNLLEYLQSYIPSA